MVMIDLVYSATRLNPARDVLINSVIINLFEQPTGRQFEKRLQCNDTP